MVGNNCLQMQLVSAIHLPQALYPSTVLVPCPSCAPLHYGRALTTWSHRHPLRIIHTPGLHFFLHISPQLTSGTTSYNHIEAGIAPVARRRPDMVQLQSNVSVSLLSSTYMSTLSKDENWAGTTNTGTPLDSSLIRATTDTMSSILFTMVTSRDRSPIVIILFLTSSGTLLLFYVRFVDRRIHK